MIPAKNESKVNMGLCLNKLTFILSFVTIVLLFGFGIEPILFIRDLSRNVRIEEASPPCIPLCENLPLHEISVYILCISSKWFGIFN